MEALYQAYAPRAFVVLAFPCNQFGGQEPGGNADVEQFARDKGATFPMMAKVDVNNDAGGEEPLWHFLKDGDGGADVGWNFEKFLVGRDGQVIKRYASAFPPRDMAKDIEAALAAGEQ